MFKFFQLATLVRLCMQISNSVVVAGLYYGFLTAGAIGPSYLLRLRARVIEEGSEKDVSATTGFLMGQLIMFISIYYAPLHLALGRPHTITILGLPYLLFHFFWRNHIEFFDSVSISTTVSTTRNAMRNLDIQCVFLTNLIFPLLNHFVLPSSTLPRLISIYMFRCNNNKMLFLTSSFVGWFIGHILCMKGFELVLFWIRQNRSIRLNRYRAAEFMEFLDRIFVILLFISCVYYLDRIPSPIGIENQRKKTSATPGETDVKIDTTSEQGQEVSAEENPSLFSEDSDNIDEKLKEKKDFEQSLGTLLFDYKRWNRPLRYIKTADFKKAIRNEMSDYFFYKCRGDGKQRISFTYPPSLSTFFEMIERKRLLYTPEKLPSDELYNHWIYTNEQKRNSLSNELFNRIDALAKGSLDLDVLEKRTRLCNDKTAQKCLPKRYDSFLNGPSRGTTTNLENLDLPSSVNMKKENEKEIQKIKKDYLITSRGDSKEKVWINKFHGILLGDYHKLEQKLETFDGKSLLSDQGKMDSKNQVKYLFEAITTDQKDQTKKKKKRLDLREKEIHKKVPRWPYQLISDYYERTLKEEDPDWSQIISRYFKSVVIFDLRNIIEDETEKEDEEDEEEDPEVTFIRFSEQSDCNRALIKGSVRAQRRKTVIWKIFQTNIHSPLFLDRIDTIIDTIFSRIIESMHPIFWIFRNWIGKGTKVQTWDSEEDEAQERENEAQEREYEAQEREDKAQESENLEAEVREKEEEERREIAELWDITSNAHAMRGCLLLAHSFIRKYLVLPSVIIAKNISLILLFQFKSPEWDEDWKAWDREIHVKCTHNGVPLSETEFPKNWLTEGMQIKIIFPFHLKIRYSSKLQPHPKAKDPMQNKIKKANSYFLTTWGKETERPFGPPRKGPHLLEPIYKEFENVIRKAKKKCFLLLKQKAKWIINPFIKIKQLEKVNPNKKFGLRDGYELSETKNIKNSITIISNQIIDESSNRIQSMDWTNFSLTEKKMKDLADRTSTIRKQIEKITNDKKTKFLIADRNISPSQASFDDKRFELPKNFWQIVKRRSVRLIRKGRFFLAFFIESISFQCLINISRVDVQPFLEFKKTFLEFKKTFLEFKKTFLEFKKKIIDTYSYNEQTNQEGIFETKENTIHLISTIKKQFSNISENNSKNFCELFSLSQAYVFYKLSQSAGIHKYPLKSVLHYHRTSLFLKDRIKNFFGTQGIFHSESKHKELRNAEMNEWKNWLRGHYQYDFSHTRLSRFMSQKWRNRVNQSRTVQNIGSTSLDSYEKNQLTNYEKQKVKAASLSVKTEKLKKHYRYDLLSHKYINSEERKDFSSPLQVNEGREIPYKYNTYKPEFFYIRRDIRENPDRKYLDWQIIRFRKTSHIKAWINKKTNLATYYYPIIDTIDKKYLSYRAIHKQLKASNNKKKNNNKNKKKNNNKNKKKNNPFDWMGMNKERLTQTQRRKKSIYDRYRMKPWIIPIKLLLFEFNINQKIRDIRENKKKKIKEKIKKDLELENRNQEKKEKKKPGQGKPRSNRPNQGKNKPNQQKDVKQDSGGSDIEKPKKKKQGKKKKKPSELMIFMKKEVRLKNGFLDFQVNWNYFLEEKLIKNINLFCFLLRLRNPMQIAISFIRRREMLLSIMPSPKRKPKPKTPEVIKQIPVVIKREIMILKPVRIHRKWDGPLIMYQTIAISLIHKNKYQYNRKTTRKCREKRNVDRNSFSEFITKQEKVVGNRGENHYDLLVPEKISSPRRRRELRILICLNSGKENLDVVSKKKNTVFCNENNVKNCGPLLTKSKHLDIGTNQFIKLKFFLWPNYRFEDLACMNRYWFDTSNGSRFSMSRIQMYPHLRIH